jgi:mannonate dehydratase
MISVACSAARSLIPGPWFRILRQQSSIPLAMGELFNTVQEYLPLISERLIDFIRILISQIGGLTPGRKVAALSEFFGRADGVARPGRRLAGR